MKAFVDEKLQDTPMGGMPGMGGNPFMPSFGGSYRRLWFPILRFLRFNVPK